MKKTILNVLLIITSITYAQKKSNGTIYTEHPAIKVVESMTQAFVNGESEKVASYLTDDFIAYNGVSTDKSDKGQNKETFSKAAKEWKDELDYFSIKRSLGASPDALEYKEKDLKDLVWVQTWENIKGVHKKTGVKMDMPLHRMFCVTKDGKIKTIITYSNTNVSNEIGQSFDERENGTIYNHHENINSVRKMVYAFENKDFDKAYAYYDEKALFKDINEPGDKTHTLTEQKANDKKILEKYDITSVDQVGYPDYLHYQLDNAKVVMSWWNMNLVRKSDKKAIVLPMMFIDNFNDDGKVTYEIAYYSAKLLD